MSVRKVFIPAIKVIHHEGRYSLKPPAGSVDRFRELLKYVYEKRGGFISASYDIPRRPRTTGKNSQSAHFNGHCQTISQVTGQPMDDVRKFMKALAVGSGYPILVDSNGQPILDLWGNIQGMSEADASVDDAKILIDTVHRWADEESIALIEEST